MSKNLNYRDLEHNFLSEKEVKEYVLGRFSDAKQENKIKNLVSFQTMNKYMIMAHDQEELKKLGNIVASYKKMPFVDIWENYEKHLIKTLENKPTIKKHSNVILHIFGHFSKKFDHKEKKKFLDLFEKYREEKITLGKILLETNSLVFRFNNTYLANQTYFLLYSDPQPNIFSNI